MPSWTALTHLATPAAASRRCACANHAIIMDPEGLLTSISFVPSRPAQCWLPPSLPGASNRSMGVAPGCLLAGLSRNPPWPLQCWLPPSNPSNMRAPGGSWAMVWAMLAASLVYASE
jgi:hypothetical protein